MVIHDAMPLIGSPRPVVFTWQEKTLLGRPWRQMDMSAAEAWGWIRQTPVWARLVAKVPNVDCARLVCVGCNDSEAEEVGLPIFCQFAVPHHFDLQRQSWTKQQIEVAVNEDGTRGGVAKTEMLEGPNEAHEMAMESLACREGGGIPDVD